MNPPKDYAPYLTLAEMRQRKLHRQQKIDEWVNNGLWFTFGIIIGFFVVGAWIWG